MVKSTGTGSGVERRRGKRRPILESFSLFIVVPRKGVHRLAVRDLSEVGMGFDLDTEGESATDFPLKAGDPVEVRFYLNQSLFLPLTLEIARVEEKGGVRRVGAAFNNPKDLGYQGYLSFLKMLDGILDLVQFDTPQ
jgi:hypothetical protein